MSKRFTMAMLSITCTMLWATAGLAQQPDAGASAPLSADGAKFPLAEAAATAPAPAASQPVTGSVAVRVLQGTQGGPAIGAIDFELELHHRGMLLDTIKSRTDEHGVALIENLPGAMQIQPLVRVEYAHLTYQVEGSLMDVAHPWQQIDLVCYEPTEQPPAWRVTMRHVMIAEAQPPAQGLHVTEVIVIDNPATHTWIGIPGRGGANPKRITTAFALPRGAHDVALGRGFHDWCCSTLADGRLINHLPLMPGATEMRYSYLVPATEGSATLDIAAPAGVDHMMVLLPDAMTVASFKGMQASGTQAMGENRVQAYLASNLHAGDAASIQLAGLRSEAGTTEAGKATAAGGALASAKAIAAIGGGVILLAAVALLVFKSGRRSASARPDAA